MGRILSYSRSNSDGSELEKVHVYRATAHRVEVNKAVEPCTTSALVTADLDLKAQQPVRLVAGKLNRQGGQDAFGTLTRKNDRLIVELGDHREELPVPPGPWMLYDFDLADLTALLPARRDYKADFAFGVALVWPEDSVQTFLRWHGPAKAHYAESVIWKGRTAYRFDVTGAVSGPLWLDAKDGHVLEAKWAQPNHPGYTDYHLVLDAVDDGGAGAWRALVMKHWQDCGEG
ncbi:MULTISPECIES: hypothetical protein [Asticcacaulis]|uniref:hypothetical protein n=1 Tax=Asticcacaulis TaxID=76890 RepID=UPI001AE37190|nr:MULTISPECIES: hypothetical protein [Asticcacaulis]MBP2157654.1 hypothetical protein [Asticcacaulis solisilvae]MDR6798699.1 hypothetical protein [Asticcacaulis sp. BE141]